jgi:uncharacterized repeat protein (TIGR01451 family)
MRKYYTFPLTAKILFAGFSFFILFGNSGQCQKNVAQKSSIEISRFLEKNDANTGDTVYYNLTVKNLLSKSISNIQVLDSLNENVFVVALNYQKGKFDDMRGVWEIGQLSAKESVSIRFGVKIVDAGLLAFNSQNLTVEGKSSSFQKPYGQSNIILTVPFKICSELGQSIVLTADTGYKNYQWYKNGQALPQQTNNYLVAYSAGEYGITHDGHSVENEANFHPFVIQESCETLNNNPSFKLVKRN